MPIRKDLKMLFCEDCASKKNMASSIMKKFGNCDECGRYTLCNLNTGKKSPAEEILAELKSLVRNKS